MNETPNKQQSILAGDESAAAPKAPVLGAPPRTGLLVTNHLNLMYMLGAGLLMPPSGFGGKHYRDTLAEYAGWLPLFIGQGRRAARAPRVAIEKSTSEAKHLRPVLVEIELAGLSGPVHVHGDGGWSARRFETGTARDEWLLCVPAPLPTTRIRSILFRSTGDRRETQAEAAERSNVPLADFNRKTARTRFSGSQHSWPPADGPAERDVSLASAQAAGGVMGVLQALASSGELAVTACRAAFDPDSAAPDDPILRTLPEWIKTGAPAVVGVSARTAGDLFWGAVNRVVERRLEPTGGRSEDTLFGFLQEASGGMEIGLRRRAADLMKTLESLGGGVGGETISAMLDRHETPLARAMILFFLRQRSAELVDIFKSYPQISEQDRLAAAVLFGVRDGWLKLPLQMRGARELGSAVTHRMAALAQRLDATGIDLGEAPARLQPLRELFGDPEAWGRREESAAVRLASRSTWDCVTTRVSLQRGRYALSIEGGAAHIDFRGEPKVASRVRPAEFLEYFARDPVEPKIEAEVRGMLAG